MASVEETVANVQRKIDREKALITAANSMRQSTNNPAVLSRLDGQIKDGRRNIEYFESKLRDLDVQRTSSGMENMSLQGGGRKTNNPLTPPPKDGWNGYVQQDQGGYGSPQGQYSQISGGDGLMPPRAPYAPPAPGGSNKRPNFSKLDLIKYDTPHLGPRIQLMLSQLEFKLSVEKQYKDGIEKMVRLYQMEGDRKSKQDAEAKRIESNQKIQLLKHSLKRYEDLHVDIGEDGGDDDSLNIPSQRKPLSGHLSLRIHAVADVDHATTSRFSRGPETFVNIKVEDTIKGRTKPSRNDRWVDEVHEFSIEKANEIEITVYDKTGEHLLPIGMLWVRISDIAEEMRRKKIETELQNSGWVSADKMGGSGIQPDLQFQPPPGQSFAGAGGPAPGGMRPQGQGGPQPLTGPVMIDDWFSLEPVGRIHLTMSFAKHTGNKQPFDLGLGRKGAVRQRKEDVVEQYGHKFVQQQFYNVMRCALCGEFLKYAAGMQCSDCNYTCHKKCYSKVVTKCITQSNAETDPDEAKLNHRIPHRFENFSNMGANWCCHCGYVLPFGRKQTKKCTECGLTCHAHCVHFVPDFCGMSMEVANQILMEIKRTRRAQPSTSGTTSMTDRKFRQPPQAKPLPPTQQQFPPQPGQEPPLQTDRYSYGKEQMSPPPGPPRQQSYPTSATSIDAARVSYSSSSSTPTPTSPTSQQRPSTGRSQSSVLAAQAAMKQTPGPAYGRSNTDYQPQSGRTSGSGYPADQRVQQQQQQQQQPAPQQSTYDPGAYANIPSYPPSHQQPASIPTYPQKSSYPLPQPPPQAQPSHESQAPPQPTPAKQTVPPPSQAQPPSAATKNPENKITPPANTQGTGKRIGLDHFNFLAVLGKGNFGKVMLAETKSTKQLYAIKVLKKEFIIENDEVESTRSEKRVFLIANKERHPFLLNLHACFQTETRVYFVMEYISGGDLMLHIQRGQFGTKRAQFYAAEVCLALKYFHENGVIYRDLKLDNILLTLDGHIKIADYGLCKEEMWYGSTTSTFCGTPEFMAPEILLDKKYGRAVDWWAFGVLIYQMLLQQSPFRGEDEDEIYDAILADEPLYPIHMPRDSVSILQKLLTREPEMRLGSGPTDAQEIMSHAFFRNINWDDIYHKRVPAPFIPQITSPTDTSNFDTEFTSVTPVLTPVQSVLSQAMQEEFRGFSYSADFN
ncbi:protein kinase C [Pyrenochaeta sp. MPI-SDFR-AT-0127]|nr:protein kinase C [Pyrenochaeta sp. MPI-SDFR-AT-0127]